MAAGKQLIERVAAVLDMSGKRVTAIARNMSCSDRAIRYALDGLIETGRARRQGYLYFAMPDPIVDVVDAATRRVVSAGVALKSCFPNNAHEYALARALLARACRPRPVAAPGRSGSLPS